MRDIINATIDEKHFLKCSTYSIARNGEGLTPCLSITIPKSLFDYWAYIDFKKPNGETFKTYRIDVSEGKITYNIPSAVLDADGELEVQVVFQNDDGEIWKTYVKEFAVRYSINATDDIPDKQNFITEAQKIVDEAEETAKSLEERAENGEFKGDKGDKGDSYILTETDKTEIAESVSKSFAGTGQASIQFNEGRATSYCSYAVNFSRAETPCSFTANEGQSKPAEENNLDSGGCSYAVNKGTTKAYCGFASGYETEVLHERSFTGGLRTKTSSADQMVIGKYNKDDPKALFIVGNGIQNTDRSNAFCVYKDGSVNIGGVTISPTQLTQLLALLG